MVRTLEARLSLPQVGCRVRDDGKLHTEMIFELSFDELCILPSGEAEEDLSGALKARVP